MKTALLALTATFALGTAAAAMTPHAGAATTLTPRDTYNIDAGHFSDTVMGAVSIDADKILTPRDHAEISAEVTFYRANTGEGNAQQTPR